MPILFAACRATIQGCLGHGVARRPIHSDAPLGDRLLTLELDATDYPILIFRIYTTATAPASDVRPSEAGAFYGDFRIPAESASDEAVDNSRATAYEFCDDRVFQETARQARFSP